MKMPEMYYFMLIGLISINCLTLMIATSAGSQIMICKLSSAAQCTHTKSDPAQLRLLLHALIKQGMLGE